MKPKVTIGVCVRNCQDTISEAIQSILTQDFPHELMEIIFVDESEDNTLSIIKECASKVDMKIKIFHYKGKGLGYSRNVVVNNAHGDYIVWVDGDNVLPPDHVRKQVEFMEGNPNVGIGKARYMMPKESLVAILENIPFMVSDKKPEIKTLKLPGTAGTICRLEVIKQAGGFDSDLKGTGEDQDVAYRVAAMGLLISRTPAFFYERRVNTWRKLWNKYFWYGYGDHDLYCKNRKIFSLYRMNPLAGFIAGALYIHDAYELTNYKVVFLLPFHFAFKMFAWCLGFAKAHVDFERKNT